MDQKEIDQRVNRLFSGPTPPTPTEKFERALWEAETAIQDAKDLIGDILPTDDPTNYTRSVITSGMLLAMLQIASATITSVRGLHHDFITRKP